MLLSWEIYPIILVAAFLRFFRINATIFGRDETDLYQVARETVVHHWLLITGQRGSLGNMHMPLAEYFQMLPALVSPNPIWGQAFTALLNTLAILLTYIFVRCYYGRLAGTIAAALFATSVTSWMYSRYIWGPNLESLLVVIFFWLLFRGVVGRRRRWFFPALILLGALYQLHESTLVLVIPLGAAVIMAYKTIRWREIGYALLGLLLLFSTYLYWEFYSGFSDLKMMISSAQQQALYNLAALRDYLFFVHPTLVNPYTSGIDLMRDNHLLLPDKNSVLISTPLRYTHLFLRGSYGLALLFLFAGLAIALALVLFPRLNTNKASDASVGTKSLRHWWADFQATPLRQGLLLLLLWQVVPLILLIRHSVVLFDHYLIFFLPGQFILMAIAIKQGIEFVQRLRPAWERWARYGLSILAALVILAQLIGTAGTAVDLTSGNFNYQSDYPPYTDLQSQQNALQAADQLAQQRGIHRIYALVPSASYSTIDYLSQQIQTPVEINAADYLLTNCLSLPNVAAGPVVMLIAPTLPLTQILAVINQYDHATLVSKPPLMGGDPYQLYLLSAKASPAPIARNFTQGLQLLSPSASLLPGTNLLTTLWQATDTRQPDQFTSYKYDFNFQESNGTATLDCLLSSTWAGDQLAVYQDLGTQAITPTSIDFQVLAYTTQRTLIHSGSLTMVTFQEVNTNAQQLSTTAQGTTLTVPVATHP